MLCGTAAKHSNTVLHICILTPEKVHVHVQYHHIRAWGAIHMHMTHLCTYMVLHTKSRLPDASNSVFRIYTCEIRISTSDTETGYHTLQPTQCYVLICSLSTVKVKMESCCKLTITETLSHISAACKHTHILYHTSPGFQNNSR